MKKLYDHQVISLHSYGGISRYFYELAKHMAIMSEQEVEIFAPFYFNEYLAVPSASVHKGIKIPKLSGAARLVTCRCRCSS